MDPVTLFEPEFARRALLATLLLAFGGGLIGATVVLRDLPFFVHGVGAGAFPALVLGAVLAVPVYLAGYAGAAAFALLLWLVSREGADPRTRDTRTGLLVASSLALGAVLANEFAGDAGVLITPEAMLFGSVLTVTPGAIAFAGAVAAIAAAAVWLRGERWLAAGFDRGAARGLGVTGDDALMLQAAALVTAAALPLTGALMAGALIVIPAATARMLARRAGTMTLLSPIIGAVAGVSGLYLSLAFDLPAGATIAAAAAGIFLLTAAAVSLRRSPARGAAAAALPLVVLALAGCGAGSSGVGGESGEGVAVVATTTQVADLAHQIGGDHVRVTTLLGAGDDPHAFEPTPSDVAALEDARVIFMNGGDIDRWLEPAIDAAGGARKPIDLSNGAVLIPPGAPEANSGDGGVPAGDDHTGEPHGDGSDSGDDHAAETFNAHWSLDPENLRSVALLVRDELIKADPGRRETYRAKAADFRSAVADASKRLRSCARSAPAARRSVAAGHDDFVYLTERFGFTTAALLRSGGHTEPSAADVERATADARDGGATSYLVSRGEAGRLDKSIASELDVPLLELYGDSLASSGEASTALGAIVFNLRRIVDAAGGDAASCDEAG